MPQKVLSTSRMPKKSVSVYQYSMSGYTGTQKHGSGVFLEVLSGVWSLERLPAAAGDCGGDEKKERVATLFLGETGKAWQWKAPGGMLQFRTGAAGDRGDTGQEGNGRGSPSPLRCSETMKCVLLALMLGNPRDAGSRGGAEEPAVLGVCSSEHTHRQDPCAS